MRVLARISCALAGLAFLTPAAATAGMPPMPNKPKAAAARAARAQAAQPERLCANCLRLKTMAEQGVDIPPPPPLPQGVIQGANMCTRCGNVASIVAGPNLPSRNLPMPGQPMMTGPGGVMMAGNAPGYASTADGAMMMAGNGVDPAPIGAVQGRLAAAGPVAGPRGLRDGSVMPTSVGADAITLPPSRRPHVISHLLGVSELGRGRSAERERRQRETHAAIPYGTVDNTVTDISARAVYGRNGH